MEYSVVGYYKSLNEINTSDPFFIRVYGKFSSIDDANKCQKLCEQFREKGKIRYTYLGIWTNEFIDSIKNIVFEDINEKTIHKEDEIYTTHKEFAVISYCTWPPTIDFIPPNPFYKKAILSKFNDKETALQFLESAKKSIGYQEYGYLAILPVNNGELIFDIQNPIIVSLFS